MIEFIEIDSIEYIDKKEIVNEKDGCFNRAQYTEQE